MSDILAPVWSEWERLADVPEEHRQLLERHGWDPFLVEAACAATTEAPHKRWSRRGGIPGEPLALPAVGPVTLCSQKKSSPFRTIFPPAWGMGPWTMPEVECRPGNYRPALDSLGRFPSESIAPVLSIARRPAAQEQPHQLQLL
jgi:hypothetical protein